MECQLEGEWIGIGLYMVVAMNIAVEGEGRAVMELTQGVVHAVLQQVLKEEEQHWPEEEKDLVLEVDQPVPVRLQVLLCLD